MVGTEPSARFLSRELEQERDYWIQRLSHQFEPSGLPRDQEASPFSGEKDRVGLTLDGDLLCEIQKLTGESQFLLYTTMLACVMISLHKYTGNTSIIVGTPARLKDRNLPQNPNVLAVIAEFDDSLTFRQLLLNLREYLLSAYSKQSYPFVRLLRDLNLEEPGDRCPLFNVVVALRDIHTEIIELKNDISVIFDSRDNELAGIIEYKKGLFAKSRIERFAAHLAQLLSSALADTNARLVDLRMLPEADLQALLCELNDTAEEFPDNICIHHIFRNQAQATPDATSIVFQDQHITYGQLDLSANQLSHYLVSLGAAPDLLTGICLDPCVDVIITILAVLKSGGAYVPLDPQYPV